MTKDNCRIIAKEGRRFAMKPPSQQKEGSTMQPPPPLVDDFDDDEEDVNILVTIKAFAENPVEYVQYWKDNWTRQHTKYLIYAILAIIGCVALLGLAGFALWYLSESGYLLIFLQWVDEIGYYGNLVMIGCLLLMNFPFMAGYSVLMMTSGFLFGWIGGVITVAVGCQIGVAIVFLIVRIKYFRTRSLKYIDSQPYILALMEEITHHQTKFAIIVRTTPLPVGLQNVLLANTKIPFWKFQVTSFIGMLIEQIPVVYIGSSAGKLASIIAGDMEITWQYIFALVVSGVGVLLFCGLLFMFARNALKRVKQRERELKREQRRAAAGGEARPDGSVVAIELEDVEKLGSDLSITAASAPVVSEVEVELPAGGEATNIRMSDFLKKNYEFVNSEDAESQEHHQSDSDRAPVRDADAGEISGYEGDHDVLPSVMDESDSEHIGTDKASVLIHSASESIQIIRKSSNDERTRCSPTGSGNNSPKYGSFDATELNSNDEEAL